MYLIGSTSVTYQHEVPENTYGVLIIKNKVL